MKPTRIVALAFVGVFLLGAVFGAVGGVRYAKQPKSASSGPKRGTPEHFTMQQMKRLKEPLKLTPEQSDRILPILMRAGEETGKIRRECFGRMEPVISQMEDDVARELTPEQQTKLRELKHERLENLRKLQAERERDKAKPAEGLPGAPLPGARPPSHSPAL